MQSGKYVTLQMKKLSHRECPHHRAHIWWNWGKVNLVNLTEPVMGRISGPLKNINSLCDFRYKPPSTYSKEGIRFMQMCMHMRLCERVETGRETEGVGRASIGLRTWLTKYRAKQV